MNLGTAVNGFVALWGLWAVAGSGRVCGAEPAPTVPAEPKPITLTTRTEPVREPYDTQLLEPLDRPVKDVLELVGRKYTLRRTEKGDLEIDLNGDGSFKRVTPGQPMTISLKREGVSRTLSYPLLFRRAEDAWTVRSLLHMTVTIGKDEAVVVDANANGFFNEPGVDGMTWKGETYLFPLPASGERWCTETQVVSNFTMGPWGEDARAVVLPIVTTTPEALPILIGVNHERIKIGLTPRPEDSRLSEDLQKHCVYMKNVNNLTHGEDAGAPGFTKEGHAAGMRSILGNGYPPARLAVGMTSTYFHRQDVIRPATMGFGVGQEGRFGGIDGRTALDKKYTVRWPVLWPAPGQKGVGWAYAKEAPDATPGDNAAGYPITAYFDTARLTLDEYRLTPIKAGKPGESIDCYEYDPKKGASADMTRFQKCVCIIAKDPLATQTEYEVMFKATVDGKPWEKTWRFVTGAGRTGTLRK